MTRHHHSTQSEAAPGVWVVARPLRDSSWWRRWRAARQCRRDFGHCWHPDGPVDWWCCMCGSETDGWPPQRCVYCAPVDEGEPDTAEVPAGPQPQGDAR